MLQIQTVQANPFSEYTVVNEYRWLNNYAVLYKNNLAGNECFLDSNNLRCVIALLPLLYSMQSRNSAVTIYTNEIFAEYLKNIEHKNHNNNITGTGVIDSKKHAVILEYKNCEKPHSDKTSRKEFIIEGERLIKRAVDDRLMIKNIIYSNKSPLEKDGYIQKAQDVNCPCYRSNEGFMSAVTSSKPVPSEIALCIMPEYSFEVVLYGEYTSLLITDNIQNPDNLGLVIRTADACGADAVIVTGEGAAAPYHKNCVRASRGALGRLPIFYFPVGKPVIAQLKSAGIFIIGTSAHGKTLIDKIYKFDKSDKSDKLDKLDIPKKFAAVIGSEASGITPEIAKLCDIMVKIEMARGQSSFNVAVAAGIILNLLMM